MRSFTVTLFSTFVHHYLNDNNQNHATAAEHHRSLVLMLTITTDESEYSSTQFARLQRKKTLTYCFSNSVQEL